jgi:ferredoxin
VVITKRFWCRAICPAGAIYSIISRYSLLTRVVNRCVNCMECEPNCRMSAIKKDMSYAKAECILCMDCIYDCPTHATRFTFFKKAKGKKSWGFAWPARQTKIQTEGSISRKEFLLLITSSFLLLGFRNRAGLGFAGKKLIRPPGVNNEREFLSKCVRCGNCMRACPTNGLQPVIFELGFSGIWTPHLVPEIGYCEYNCNLCGNVCPTGAIPRLTLAVKKEQKLGYAVIDKDICLPWSQNKECIVCEEHCPVATKAIKTYDEVFKDKKIKKPYVDVSLCIGCGICQNKCPTRPVRAVKVSISTM